MAKFFSAELKRRRRALKLTQEQLGERAGITATSVYRLEAGRYKPSINSARALAKALKCRVDDLGEP